MTSATTQGSESSGRWRRLGAILRLEFGKSFRPRRAWWVYLLALAPMALTGGHSAYEIYRAGAANHTIATNTKIFAAIFEMFYLRLGIFFGCVGIFMNLFRGEVLERTLHYYFLAPVRRELLVVGKYLAGLLAAVVVFAASVALSFNLVYLNSGHDYREFMLAGPGMRYLWGYLLVTVLAVIGYGAVFLMMGLRYQNPMIPAAVVMGWEGINPFLPSLLQKISVIFYLKALSPFEVPIEEIHGPWALLAVQTDPVPGWLAIPGLLLVSALIVWMATRSARSFEINYTE